MVRILPAQGATGHFAQDQSMLRRILLTSAVSLAALLHAQAAEVIFRASPSVYEPAPKSVLSASPSALAGVDSDDAAKTVLVTISNRGPAATTVPATPSVSSGPFQIASDGCTGTLAVGASCQIGVRTTQTSVGDVSGSLSIRGLAGGVALSGRVKGPTTCTTVGTACTDGTTYLGTYDGSKWRASYDPAVFTWKTAVPACAALGSGWTLIPKAVQSALRNPVYNVIMARDSLKQTAGHWLDEYLQIFYHTPSGMPAYTSRSDENGLGHLFCVKRF